MAPPPPPLPLCNLCLCTYIESFTLGNLVRGSIRPRKTTLAMTGAICTIMLTAHCHCEHNRLTMAASDNPEVGTAMQKCKAHTHVLTCVCCHHVVVWSLPQCTLKGSSTLSVAQTADQHVPTPPPLMAVPHNACRDASVPPNMVEYNGDCIMASNCTISTLPPPPRPPIIVATNFTSG